MGGTGKTTGVQSGTYTPRAFTHLGEADDANGEEDRDALTYERQDFCRHQRRETGRFRCFDYKTLVARDKASLDIFWLKDDSLDNLDDLPPPDVLALEIVEHLEAALASFRDVAAGLPKSAAK